MFQYFSTQSYDKRKVETYERHENGGRQSKPIKRGKATKGFGGGGAEAWNEEDASDQSSEEDASDSKKAKKKLVKEIKITQSVMLLITTTLRHFRLPNHLTQVFHKILNFSHRILIMQDLLYPFLNLLLKKVLKLSVLTVFRS